MQRDRSGHCCVQRNGTRRLPPPRAALLTQQEGWGAAGAQEGAWAARGQEGAWAARGQGTQIHPGLARGLRVSRGCGVPGSGPCPAAGPTAGTPRAAGRAASMSPHGSPPRQPTLRGQQPLLAKAAQTPRAPASPRSSTARLLEDSHLCSCSAAALSLARDEKMQQEHQTP